MVHVVVECPLTTIQHWLFSFLFPYDVLLREFWASKRHKYYEKKQCFHFVSSFIIGGYKHHFTHFLLLGCFWRSITGYFLSEWFFFFNWTKIWHELYTILDEALALLSGRYNLINKFSTKFCQIVVWIIQKSQFCRKKITCADIYNIYNNNIIEKCRNC